MRSVMVFLPQSMSLRPWMMFLRACSLSSGATASSRSRNTTSALEAAAFSNMPGAEPGTASSERCRREVACSISVKLMSISLLRLARGPKARGDATDGEEQRNFDLFLRLLVLRGAEPPQQLDLLPV